MTLIAQTVNPPAPSPPFPPAKAKAAGRIGAIGFSAHSEPMAVKMIESGKVRG